MKLLILMIAIPLVLGGTVQFEEMWSKVVEKYQNDGKDGKDGGQDVDKGDNQDGGKDSMEKPDWMEDFKDAWRSEEENDEKAAYKEYLKKHVEAFREYMKKKQYQQMQEKKEKMALFEQMQNVKSKMNAVEELENLQEDFQNKQKMLKQGVLTQFMSFCECGGKGDVILRVKDGRFAQEEEGDYEGYGMGDMPTVSTTVAPASNDSEGQGESQMNIMNLEDLVNWMMRLNPEERKKEILKDLYNVVCGGVNQFVDYMSQVEKKVKSLKQEKEREDKENKDMPCGDGGYGCGM